MARQSFTTVDCCPAQAADQVGDKWTLVILRNAFQDVTRFDEFSSIRALHPMIWALHPMFRARGLRRWMGKPEGALVGL